MLVVAENVTKMNPSSEFIPYAGKFEARQGYGEMENIGSSKRTEVKGRSGP